MWSRSTSGDATSPTSRRGRASSSSSASSPRVCGGRFTRSPFRRPPTVNTSASPSRRWAISRVPCTVCHRGHGSSCTAPTASSPRCDVAVRDTVTWMIPLLWPIDLINLPRRGPYPTLKEETRLTLKVMDDLGVPMPDQQPLDQTPSGLYKRPSAWEEPAPAPPPPQQITYVQPAPPPPTYVYMPPPVVAMVPPPRTVVVYRNGYAYRVA